MATFKDGLEWKVPGLLYKDLRSWEGSGDAEQAVCKKGEGKNMIDSATRKDNVYVKLCYVKRTLKDGDPQKVEICIFAKKPDERQSLVLTLQKKEKDNVEEQFMKQQFKRYVLEGKTKNDLEEAKKKFLKDSGKDITKKRPSGAVAGASKKPAKAKPKQAENDSDNDGDKGKPEAKEGAAEDEEEDEEE